MKDETVFKILEKLVAPVLVSLMMTAVCLGGMFVLLEMFKAG